MRIIWAVSKSGTDAGTGYVGLGDEGTWDLRRGTWDVGTWDVKKRGLGDVRIRGGSDAFLPFV